jgi:hypothetical protein
MSNKAASFVIGNDPPVPAEQVDGKVRLPLMG